MNRNEKIRENLGDAEGMMMMVNTRRLRYVQSMAYVRRIEARKRENIHKKDKRMRGRRPAAPDALRGGG